MTDINTRDGTGAKSSSENERPFVKTPRALPKRFYKTVRVHHGEQSHQILLDGRPVKTPKRNTLEVPSPRLAQALQLEWEEQECHIDPASMPLTRLVNAALDGIAGHEAEVIESIAQYLESDAVCYRAKDPQALVLLQQKAWDPILLWASRDLGLDLKPTQGVMPVAQPGKTLNKAVEHLSSFGALELAAIHVMTTLTGSLLICLSLVRGFLTHDEAWTGAHIDEDFQVRQWGEDHEAMVRRTLRRQEFDAAHRLLRKLSNKS